MTTDYRAMCAELVDSLHKHTSMWEGHEIDLVARARALLARPDPQEPTYEEITSLAKKYRSDVGDGFTEMIDDEVGFARAVLAKWGTLTPQPVAVSERLPGPEDCLDEGWAWFFNQRIGWRQAVLPVSPGYTHWLPANALPTPEAQ